MEVRCPAAFARTGCRWVTATARSTTPTLTNNLIPVSPRTNDPRTAIPFGRETNALPHKCGQRRTRQAVAREGGHAKRNPKLARERAIGTALFRHPIHLRDGDSVWPTNVRSGMEVRCTMAFAVAGCRWVTVSARSTTPTLTTNRIIVNPSTNDPRTAIPFGRKTHALTRKCGQKRTRKALAREGGHAKRNPKLARERAIGTALFRHPIHLRDGDSVWPTNVRSHSDNARLSATASVFDMAWWPNGMEVR